MLKQEVCKITELISALRQYEAIIEQEGMFSIGKGNAFLKVACMDLHGDLYNLLIISRNRVRTALSIAIEEHSKTLTREGLTSEAVEQYFSGMGINYHAKKKSQPVSQSRQRPLFEQ